MDDIKQETADWLQESIEHAEPGSRWMDLGKLLAKYDLSISLKNGRDVEVRFTEKK